MSIAFNPALAIIPLITRRIEEITRKRREEEKNKQIFEEEEKEEEEKKETLKTTFNEFGTIFFDVKDFFE